MSRLTLVRDVEEMPLSKENQDWVNDQIETAVTRRLNPTPRRAALDIIRTWGPPITIVAIFATLLGVTVASLIQAFSHVKEETEFRTKTGYRLDSIEKSLQVIRISSSAATPDSPVSQAEAKAVIAEARKNPSRPLPTPVVEQVGKSFTGAATTDPSAWKVALEFVSYRSSLNKFQVPPKGTQSLDPRSVTNYLDFGDVGPAKLEFPQPRVLVPASEAARYEDIGSNLNGTREGLATILMEGGKLNIDGKYAKNIVFMDMEIHYTGGKPLVLQNVTFVNCTFVIENSERSRMLADGLLGSSSVSLSIA